MRVEALERLVFFGTPDFAVPTLRALCEAGRSPVAVVSQPARPVGRGRRLQDPPVARWASNEGLPVVQPDSVRDPEFLHQMAAWRPSAAVVVAFGQIFSRQLLEIPSRGCLNLHASLLPRYRGAAPIQAAIIAGETHTGVTTMQMEEGLDSGPILLQKEAEIGWRETAGELAERLAEIGAGLMLRTLDGLEAGDLEARSQDSAQATLAPRLRKSDGELDWGQSARQLFNRIRGVTPWPGGTTQLRRRPLKVLWAEAVEGGLPAPESEPGCYLGLIGDRLAVACGDGTVLGLERVQRPGKKPLEASRFLHGEPLELGERFG